MDTGNFQNKIPELPQLNDLRFENIFKMYKNDLGQYYYNLLQNISIPDSLDETYFKYYIIRKKMPWTMVSFNIYKTIELWWLICIVNKIKNPIKQPLIGTAVRFLLPEYVSLVLTEIKNKLK